MSDDQQQQTTGDNKPEENPILLGIRELSNVIKEWITKKYSHDKTGVWVHLCTVCAILIGIIILSCKLESSIIGTLLGSLIGFAFGNFPKNGDKKSN